MKVIAAIEAPAVLQRILAQLENGPGTGQHPEPRPEPPPQFVLPGRME